MNFSLARPSKSLKLRLLLAWSLGEREPNSHILLGYYEIRNAHSGSV